MLRTRGKTRSRDKLFPHSSSPARVEGAGGFLWALCPQDAGPAYVTLHVHVARGCGENSGSFSAALTSYLVSHLTVHLLTTVPSRRFPYAPTHTQIRFLFPPPASPLFTILSAVPWGTGAGHPPRCSREGCYLQIPTPRFPPALFRFDTCVWAAARAIWLPRQTWPGHRCLPPPPPFPPRTAGMYGCLLWRVYISL